MRIDPFTCSDRDESKGNRAAFCEAERSRGSPGPQLTDFRRACCTPHFRAERLGHGRRVVSRRFRCALLAAAIGPYASWPLRRWCSSIRCAPGRARTSWGVGGVRLVTFDLDLGSTTGGRIGDVEAGGSPQFSHSGA